MLLVGVLEQPVTKSMVDVPIVLAATKYTDPDFSFSIILVVNQALSFPDVEYSLLNPNQLRYAGLDVWDNPFDTEQKLEIVGENENEDQRIVISIHMKGTILYFDTSTPTQSDLDTLAHFHLTLENEWNLHEVWLLRNEASTSQSVEEDQTNGVRESWHDGFCQSLIPGVGDRQYVAQIATVVPDTQGFQSSDCHPAVTAETLSNIWHIGLQTAKKTIEATTQRGVHSAVLPLSRHYRTDMFYCKPRL
jgi:hypothetical protein